jgi:hypothetical protein
VNFPKENRNTLDNKAFKCIFIGYKDGMKGCKLWDPVLRKIVYNRNGIFREVGGNSWMKEDQIKKEPENLVFDMRKEEHDGDELTESDE